jgi:hypothetical protein
MGFSQYPVHEYVKVTDLGSTGTAERVSRTVNAYLLRMIGGYLIEQMHIDKIPDHGSESIICIRIAT